MLTNLLIVMEERGYLKLVRNAKGEVTGGRAYELTNVVRFDTAHGLLFDLERAHVCAPRSRFHAASLGAIERPRPIDLTVHPLVRGIYNFCRGGHLLFDGEGDC